MDDLDKTEKYVRLKDVMGCLYNTLESYYIKRNIMDLPTADVKPVVRGRWISDGDCLICSHCRTAYTFSGSNYCPECGAMMMEE